MFPGVLDTLLNGNILLKDNPFSLSVLSSVSDETLRRSPAEELSCDDFNSYMRVYFLFNSILIVNFKIKFQKISVRSYFTNFAYRWYWVSYLEMKLILNCTLIFLFEQYAECACKIWWIGQYNGDIGCNDSLGISSMSVILVIEFFF